jgi:DedD protein
VAASAAAPRAASAPASASAPRFVVQVGAFTDAGALREARRRVESLGLKTYTQAVETPSGARTRVRVGPFDSRAEAEAAAKKLKAGGLPAAILAL